MTVATPARLEAVAPSAPRYFPAADLIRVVAAVAVVTGHVSANLTYSVTPFSPEFWVCIVLNAGMRWCVPVFLMLSGALLLSSERAESIGSFYRRRATRVGTPLLFWSACYAAAQVAFTHSGPWDLLTRFVGGNIFLGQYFLLMILALYVFTPFLRVFVRTASRAELRNCIIVCLAVAMGHTLTRSAHGLGFNVFSSPALYVGYFLAGAYLRDFRPTPRQQFWALLVWLTCVALIAVGNAWVSQTPEMVGACGHFLMPQMVGASFAAFILLLGAAPHANSALARRLASLSGLTLGVFLIHPALLILLHKAKLYPLWPTPLIGLVLWITTALVASAAITAVLRRMPLLQKVV